MQSAEGGSRGEERERKEVRRKPEHSITIKRKEVDKREKKVKEEEERR